MKYRKKPIVIEAKGPLTAENSDEIRQWCDGSKLPFNDGAILIQTLEGPMTASSGDYVLCGVQGEFYPCKPDIFEATYTAAE